MLADPENLDDNRLSSRLASSEGNSIIAGRVGAPAPPDRPGVSGSGRSEVPASPRVSLTTSGRKRAAVGGSQRRASPAGKPYPAFPLTRHPSGQFCKKIRGKFFYFGSVADSEAALERYHRL